MQLFRTRMQFKSKLGLIKLWFQAGMTVGEPKRIGRRHLVGFPPAIKYYTVWLAPNLMIDPAHPIVTHGSLSLISTRREKDYLLTNSRLDDDTALAIFQPPFCWSFFPANDGHYPIINQRANTGACVLVRVLPNQALDIKIDYDRVARINWDGANFTSDDITVAHDPPSQP